MVFGLLASMALTSFLTGRDRADRIRSFMFLRAGAVCAFTQC